MKLELKNNPDIQIILIIAEILDGNGTSKDHLLAELKTDDCVQFKFMSITSVNVERSFSTYNNVLFDNRRKFLFVNLKKPVSFMSIQKVTKAKQ